MILQYCENYYLKNADYYCEMFLLWQCAKNEQMNAFSIILWRMSKMVSQKNEKGVTDTKKMDFACKYFIYVTLYLFI